MVIVTKLLVYADAHFSINSSILLGQSGTVDSGRLSYLIKSFKWMYELAEKEHVDAVINLGDLVDTTTLKSEELTALSLALSYNKTIPEYHILGNHDILTNDGTINSVEFLELRANTTLIREPSLVPVGDSHIMMIPYNQYDESDVKTFPDSPLACTHLDIFGADTGGWKLKSGVDPNKLSSKYQMTLNGHIHNGSYVTNNVINIGSISGLNFSSKSINWEPSVAIVELDDEGPHIELIENPEALIFHKRSVDSVAQFIKYARELNTDKHYVIQLTVPSGIVDELREQVKSHSCIIHSKFLIDYSGEEILDETIDMGTVGSVSDVFSVMTEYISSKSKSELSFDKKDILKVINKVGESYKC